jgi:hypothetical protein
VFYYTLGGISLGCVIIQMIVILTNSLSASYFTYNDEYWTVYYVKPYTRYPGFIIGVLSGCIYYSYKTEHHEINKLTTALDKIKSNNVIAAMWMIFGTFFMMLMVIIM